MDAITYSYARQNMASVMDTVCDNNETLIITSPRKKVVMMSLDDYNSMIETCYLLSNPTNAKHLRTSIKEANDGKFSETKLADL